MASDRIKAWLSALRLRTLPLALASIVLGSFLAAADKRFSGLVFLLCAATAVLLQILSNLANDYGDYIHGADNEERRGPKRATQSGAISSLAMRVALLVFVALSLAVGYVLVKGESVLYYFLGIAAILAAVTYTAGPRPYGYVGLGDLFVFLFFGIVGVSGTYFLHTHTLKLSVLLPAVSSGFLSVAVLNINNMRDIQSDEVAGKFTIPVRIGFEKAKLYHVALVLGATGAALVYVFLNYNSAWQLLFLIVSPLLFKNIMAILKKQDNRELDPYLKQMAFTALLFSVTFGLGLLL